MIRTELMREVNAERDGVEIWLFSSLETLLYYLSAFILSLSVFPLSDVRCLKGKDKLEDESLTQMEGSLANCTCRSLSSHPSSV